MRMRCGSGIVAVCLAVAVCGHASESPDTLNLVPTPKVLKLTGGEMPLTAASRIVAAGPGLKPLAGILSDELLALTQLRMEPVDGSSVQPRAGDIVLRINPQLRADADILAVQRREVVKTRDFAHTIEVGDRVVIEGWDYRAVAEGTATILQAIEAREGKVTLPKMKVKDWPHADFTGVMVDVARQQIPVDALQAVIEACRLWKIRYCQLHLSDDEAFTFPSTAFPKLGTKNEAMHGGVTPRVYTLKELRDLAGYADARGVTLVPELATPGHSEAMARAMPDVFGTAGIMDMANDEMYKVLDTLVGEMCDVFKSSRYFHMGCEEVYFFELEERQQTKDYLRKKGMKDVNDLFVQHVQRMNEIIRRHGKMTLAWEGVGAPSKGGQTYKLPPALASQIVAMCWFPWNYTEGLQQQGFATITVPWDLGAPLSEWNLYLCNGTRLPPTARVLGASQTMWQMSASALVGEYLGGELNGSTCEGYIRSLGIRSERTWGPTNVVVEADYQKRLAATRARLEALLFPVRIDGTPVEYRAWPVLGRQYCKPPVDVKLSLIGAVGGGDIRYTVDGSEPTPESPIYTAPFAVKKTTAVHAALFRGGRQAGAVTRAVFDMKDSGWSLYR